MENRSSSHRPRRLPRPSQSSGAPTRRERCWPSSPGANSFSSSMRSPWPRMPRQKTARVSWPHSRSSFEVGRKQVRNPVLDLVPVIALLAKQRAFEDLVLLDIDGELQVSLAHRAAQDLHEISLHRSMEGRRVSYDHSAISYDARS